MLAKAAIASQRVNTYTGTDYSAIEALRQSIIEQERAVKSCHAAVTDAKEAYTASHSQQAASQKEVVGLLERKHSWASGDLERYMSLIRSEHVNEQAVQKSKDDLADAEKALEESRTNLEKKERRQYHEEQVWSDTIRRNSTWVTFGLMGLNIFLLLANLVLIEPWRRRRMVREFRSALEEKTLPSAAAQVDERSVDQVIEPAGVSLESIADPTNQEIPALTAEPQSPSANEENIAIAASLPIASETVLPAAATHTTEDNRAIKDPVDPIASTKAVPGSWGAYKESFHDLFSERPVSLKKVDVTTIALEGAAAGVAAMGLVFVLLRPR